MQPIVKQMQLRPCWLAYAGRDVHGGHSPDEVADAATASSRGAAMSAIMRMDVLFICNRMGREAAVSVAGQPNRECQSPPQNVKLAQAIGACQHCAHVCLVASVGWLTLNVESRAKEAEDCIEGDA
jgi:hypothetical protein